MQNPRKDDDDEEIKREAKKTLFICKYSSKVQRYEMEETKHHTLVRLLNPENHIKIRAQRMQNSLSLNGTGFSDLPAGVEIHSISIYLYLELVSMIIVGEKINE